MSVVFTLKDIMGLSIFVSCGSKDRKKWCTEGCGCCHFIIVWKIASYHSDMRGLLTTSPIWSSVGGFVGRLINLFLMDCMCVILLNMNRFDWRLVLMMSLDMQEMMTCTLLHFTVSFWIDMASKTYWNDVGSFLPMLRIQTLVLYLAVHTWFYVLLFSDWEMYDMLWCSQYCVTMQMGVPLDGKLTLPSKI